MKHRSGSSSFALSATATVAGCLGLAGAAGFATPCPAETIAVDTGIAVKDPGFAPPSRGMRTAGGRPGSGLTAHVNIAPCLPRSLEPAPLAPAQRAAPACCLLHRPSGAMLACATISLAGSGPRAYHRIRRVQAHRAPCAAGILLFLIAQCFLCLN